MYIEEGPVASVVNSTLKSANRFGNKGFSTHIIFFFEERKETRAGALQLYDDFITEFPYS